MTARLLIGDVFERMAELPDGSVDLVLTSPPFLALRSYLPADHPDKAKEIGSEPTPAAFLDTLLALTAEWRRLLAPHGSICVELGDTYSGAHDSGWHRDGQAVEEPTGQRYRQSGYVATSGSERVGNGWPMAKSLCGIPHLYHLSLAYGRNLLTGEESPASQWRVRNVVAWCRPNPPVGALGDKFRPGTSYMTVACVSGQRYFDLDAVRVGLSEHSQRYYMEDSAHWQKIQQTKDDRKQTAERNDKGFQQSHPVNPAGAPPLDWWEIPTQPYPGAHYATWPAALCTRPILAMCPRYVCTACGIPWHNAEATMAGGHVPSCKCDGYPKRPGLILDPFCGSGTTLAVATGHGRDAIGIDLDARNAELVRQRVGMFLETDEPEAVA